MYMRICVCDVYNCVCTSVYVCVSVCNCVCTSVYMCVCLSVWGRKTHTASTPRPRTRIRRPFSSEPQAAERPQDHVGSAGLEAERGAGGLSQCRRATLQRRLAAAQGSLTHRAWWTTGPTCAHRVGRLQLPHSLRMERVFLKTETDGKYKRKQHHKSLSATPREDRSCQGAC